jgi:hypothetical protein
MAEYGVPVERVINAGGIPQKNPVLNRVRYFGRFGGPPAGDGSSQDPHLVRRGLDLGARRVRTGLARIRLRLEGGSVDGRSGLLVVRLGLRGGSMREARDAESEQAVPPEPR